MNNFESYYDVPIITRFNLFKFRIEFIGFKNAGGKNWAIPGGKIYLYEKISSLLKKELIKNIRYDHGEYVIDQILNSNYNVLYSGTTMLDDSNVTSEKISIKICVINYHIYYNIWRKIKIADNPNINLKIAWIHCDNKDIFENNKYFVKLAKENAIKTIIKDLLYFIMIFIVFITICIIYNKLKILFNYSNNNNDNNYYYYNYEL